VRASIAYKGCWVRRTRTFGGPVAVGDWFERVTGSLQAGTPIAAQLAGAVKKLPGAILQDWMAESCTGSYPLSVVASSRMPGNAPPIDGEFFVLTVELTVQGAPWLGAAPLIVGRASL
jgi:hypothetical protein